jgi:dTDP-4-amino-4,6-dideoxygalactose transaminase
MAVPFLALDRDYTRVRADVEARFAGVLASQVFVLGRETAELEASMKSLCRTRHAAACSSGTEALVLALLACGVGAGDAVIVPAFTFFATAGAVRRIGAVPVFADVDLESLNMGARELAEAVEREFSARSGVRVHRASGAPLRAVVVVHLFGRAACLSALRTLADDLGVTLIEDAAQAIGAQSEAMPVGSCGEAGCFSFYPTKNIGGAGDGGLVVTDDDERAARLRRLRTHGAEPGAAVHTECGFNARMGELEAAYLNAKLTRLAEWTAARERAARRYRENLSRAALADRMLLPLEARAPEHVWHQYVVRVLAGRERVRERLAARGVETRVFYPVPVHLQPCFVDLGYRAGMLPAAERLAGEVLSLPLFAAIRDAEIDEVCDSLAGAVL